MKYKLLSNLFICLTILTVLNLSNLYGQSNSIIGLTAEFITPTPPVELADKVYFIKLQEHTNHFMSDSIIETNFQKDNQIYFKNLEPGKYAVVAIGKRKELPLGGHTELTIFFSKELMQQHVVTVDANDFVFMGNFSINTKKLVSNNKSDQELLHHFRIITGKEQIPKYIKQVADDAWFYEAGIENVEFDKTTEHDFLKKAFIHFQGLKQEQFIKKKLE